jgi:hypothetical protein
MPWLPYSETVRHIFDGAGSDAKESFSLHQLNA